jgi:hypothetical protein
MSPGRLRRPSLRSCVGSTRCIWTTRSRAAGWLRDLLRGEGVVIGRELVAMLMRQMGIEAIYRRPNTSKAALGHKIYPYSAAWVGDRAGEPCLGDGHHP